MPFVVGVLDPCLPSAGPPRQEGSFFGVAVQPMVKVVDTVAHVVQSRVEQGSVRSTVVPRSIHHPKMGVAQGFDIRCRRAGIWRRPVMFDPHKDAVTFRHLITTHPHVHPGEVGQSRGLGDGEGVVKPALIQPPVRIDAQQDKGIFMPKRHLVKFSSHTRMHQGGVPRGIPQREVQGLVVVKKFTRTEFLMQVDGGGVASVVRPRGDAVHNPCAEPGLQHLRFKERRHVHP